MRAIQIAVLVPLWAVSATAHGQKVPDPPRPACTSSLDGHAVDRASHQPVAGATVRINGEPVALTDSGGRFHLTGLCPGAMEIAIERPDFEASLHRIELGRYRSLEVEMQPRLSEVVVIRGKVLAPIDMQSTTVISGEALDRTRGRSFSEALAEVPGVAQLGSGSGMAKPIVRGQFGRRLLLLVDSVPHRSQDWGLDHAPEVDPFMAGELKVVRGAAGVRYGPGAIGGAVIAEPPRLLDTPGYAGEAHLMGFAARGAGMAGRLQVAPVSLPGFAYQVEATAKRLAAASTPDYPLENTASSEWNLGASAGYRDSNGEYMLSYRRYQARLGVCACLQIESSEDFFAQLERDRPANADLYSASLDIARPYQAVAHDQASARATWPFTERGKLHARYALQFDHRREFDVVRDATGPQFDFRLTSHDLEVGFEHNPVHLSDHLHLDGSVGVVAAAQVNSYRGLPLIPDYQAVGGGVYAIERLIGHDFEVEAGLRYDVLVREASILRNDFLRLVRSDQIEPTACGDSDADPVLCDSTYYTPSATLGGLVQLSNPLSVKLELSLASRPPSPDEQYLNGTSPTFPVLGLGKPDLGPETTYSASLTTSYKGERIAAEASAYGNFISDYIYFSPAIGADGQPIFDVLIRGSFPRFVTRPVDAVFYGADGGLAFRATSRLELGTQLSMVRARNLSDDGYLVFVPPDRARVSATYTHAVAGSEDRVYGSVSSSYVARQSRFDLAADLAAPPDAYALVDAEVGGHMQLGDKLAKLSVQGTNLLNARYRDYTSMMRYFADQSGIELMVKLSIVFNSPSTTTSQDTLL